MSKSNKNIIKLEDICTFDNLVKSYMHCRKGKRFRQATVFYHMNYLQNLSKLQKDLLNGKYKPKGLYSFIIYEPKKRYITANHFEDKIVHRLLCKYALEPTIQPKLIFDNYASQPKKGTHLALHRLQHFMRSFVKENNWSDEGGALICDIKKFFYMIDQDICLDLLKQLSLDDKIQKVLEIQIRTYNTLYNEYTDEPNKGLCIGFQTSQWSAVYYLNDLDHYIKETLKIKYYGRYMDDFYLIHKDIEYLKYCREKIEKFLSEKLKLSLNKKTHIHPFKQGICFLGYHCTYNKQTHQIETGVRSKSIYRMKKRVKKHRDLIAINSIKLEDAISSLESWKAYAMHSDTTKAEYAYYKAFGQLTNSAYRNHYFYNVEMTNPHKVDKDGFYILEYLNDFRDEHGFLKLVKCIETMHDYKIRKRAKQSSFSYIMKNFRTLNNIANPNRKRKKKINTCKRYTLSKKKIAALDDLFAAFMNIE